MYLHNLETAIKAEESSIAAIRRLLEVRGMKEALALINTMVQETWQIRGSERGVAIFARCNHSTHSGDKFEYVITTLEWVMGTGCRSTDGYKLKWVSPTYGAYCEGEVLSVELQLEDYDK